LAYFRGTNRAKDKNRGRGAYPKVIQRFELKIQPKAKKDERLC
jgi:hypothetical protein